MVGDVHEAGLTKPIEPAAYVSHTQVELPEQLLDENFVLRTNQDPLSIVAAVRERIRAADQEAALKFETMDEVLTRSVARQRFQMQVLGGFAGLALMLAAIGLYGVLSYMVTSNRAGIAIRMALGARLAEIFAMVTGRALRLASGGVLLGLAGCVAVRGVLARLIVRYRSERPGDFSGGDGAAVDGRAGCQLVSRSSGDAHRSQLGPAAGLTTSSDSASSQADVT